MEEGQYMQQKLKGLKVKEDIMNNGEKKEKVIKPKSLKFSEVLRVMQGNPELGRNR